MARWILALPAGAEPALWARTTALALGHVLWVRRRRCHTREGSSGARVVQPRSGPEPDAAAGAETGRRQPGPSREVGEPHAPGGGLRLRPDHRVPLPEHAGCG